ncbi:DUF1697 domain-containing protein [Naasia aerilata]|nr:DUF1697 domain-containing protein [Naasia aerilata]
MRAVALLRGINVGGVRVPMAELQGLLADAGYANVKTLLASGNVLLDADGKPADVAQRLEKLVGERFAYPARILVVPIEEVAAAVDGYPFEAADDLHSYVVFTEDAATTAELAAEAAQLPEGDRVAASGSLLYWSVAVGSTLDSPFGKLLAKKRAPFTTTRNIRTLQKILAAG